MIYPRRKTENNEKNISPFCISSHLCEQNYECILKKNVDQPKGLKNRISPKKLNLAFGMKCVSKNFQRF